MKTKLWITAEGAGLELIPESTGEERILDYLAETDDSTGSLGFKVQYRGHSSNNRAERVTLFKTLGVNNAD